MDEQKTNQVEELQVIEDPSYVPPPEIEERINDPYLNVKNTQNENDEPITLGNFKFKTQMAIVIGALLCGYVFTMLLLTGKIFYLIPFFVLACWIISLIIRITSLSKK